MIQFFELPKKLTSYACGVPGTGFKTGRVHSKARSPPQITKVAGLQAALPISTILGYILTRHQFLKREPILFASDVCIIEKNWLLYPKNGVNWGRQFSGHLIIVLRAPNLGHLIICTLGT